MRYQVIKADRSIPVETYESPGDLSLEALRKAVSGDIELVRVHHLDRVCHMVVNETGAIAAHGRGPLPINVRASVYYHGGELRRGMPMIHGDAILFDGVLE